MRFMKLTLCSRDEIPLTQYNTEDSSFQGDGRLSRAGKQLSIMVSVLPTH